MLAQLGPLSINDHRPQVGLLPDTRPWAVQRGEHGRKDSSTVKTFVAFVQGDASPVQHPCRLLEEELHAVQADLPRVHGATFMHAQKGIVLEDSPVQPFQRRNDCGEGTFDGGPWPRMGSLDAFSSRWPAASSHPTARG